MTFLQFSRQSLGIAKRNSAFIFSDYYVHITVLSAYDQLIQCFKVISIMIFNCHFGEHAQKLSHNTMPENRTQPRNSCPVFIALDCHICGNVGGLSVSQKNIARNRR